MRIVKSWALISNCTMHRRKRIHSRLHTHTQILSKDWEFIEQKKYKSQKLVQKKMIKTLFSIIMFPICKWTNIVLYKVHSQKRDLTI